MKVLGISGKAGHGKDFCASLAQQLLKEIGHNYGIWSLAFPLKATVFGESNGGLSFGDVFVNKPVAVRRLLQERGTEHGRNKYGENTWTLQTQAYLELFKTSMPFLDGVIIPDIRFPNEVTFAQNDGTVAIPASELYLSKRGMCLRIISDRPTLTGEAAAHPSEVALDNFTGFDGVIVNNLSTNEMDLRTQLSKFLKILMES